MRLDRLARNGRLSNMTSYIVHPSGGESLMTCEPEMPRYSLGAPASRHAFHPPAIENTLV